MPHIHEKIDFTVEVFIVYRNKVLLRKHDKYDIWLGVGGHIELNEDPIEAALREAKEEAGLAVTLIGKVPTFKDQGNIGGLLAPRFLNRHKISDTHQHISMIYFAKSETNDVRPQPGEKQDGWHWFSMDELVDPSYGIMDIISYYAKEALKTAQ